MKVTVDEERVHRPRPLLRARARRVRARRPRPLRARSRRRAARARGAGPAGEANCPSARSDSRRGVILSRSGAAWARCAPPRLRASCADGHCGLLGVGRDEEPTGGDGIEATRVRGRRRLEAGVDHGPHEVVDGGSRNRRSPVSGRGGPASCARTAAIPVRRNPGHSTWALTREPCAANSLASVLCEAEHRVLGHRVGGQGGSATSAASDAVFTIAPSSCSIRRAHERPDAVHDPHEVHAEDPFPVASGPAQSSSPNPPTPALLQTTWAVPNSRERPAASCRPPWRPRRRSRRRSPRRPLAERAADPFERRRFDVRDDDAHPLRGECLRERAPIPLAPPVTTATLPRRLSMGGEAKRSCPSRHP